MTAQQTETSGEDQKIESLLNLALGATQEEREKSLELDVGYEKEERVWTLIVKYSGELSQLAGDGIEITELANEYAIVRIAQARIPFLAAQPQIEYIEKPRRLFFSVNQGRTASCMNVLQEQEIGNAGSLVSVPGVTEPLLGRGVLVAVIDSGVDYAHADFQNADGTTRILAIWDQTVAGNPPTGYLLGTEYTREQINEALRTGKRLKTVDFSGHGTQVLGIAAGNGRVSQGVQRGVAPESALLVVKLGNPGTDEFPKTTELMLALDYVFQKAQEYEMPLAVNLSFGNVYGPHNGTGLLETFLSDLANRGRAVVSVGMGNEGNTAGHASGILPQGAVHVSSAATYYTSEQVRSMEKKQNGHLRSMDAGKEMTEIELGVAAQEAALNLQLWKSYADRFLIFLVHPNGQRLGPLQENLGAQRFFAGNTELLIFYGEPSPYSTAQEIYFDFLPRAGADYIDGGIWRILLLPVDIRDGRYDLWLPSAAALNPDTRFYRPSVENTLTIPSTAAKVVSVGAYDSRSLTYAPFSGRGASGVQPQQKPDLAAPGVAVVTTAVGGGYTTVTGTSFATPFVTGAAAMLMQFGVVLGNDPYLYGEKVKAYLRRGAKPLPGFTEYPNEQVGYGALCVRESLPG